MAQAQLPFQQQMNWEKQKLQTHLTTNQQPDWEDPECQKTLKLVLRWEIQNLLHRLSDAGEEALILTANISEDTTNILGSQFGEKFMLQSDLAILKHQFLRYCRVHCKKKTRRSSPFSANKRKSSAERRPMVENGVSKRKKRVLHHIIRQDESANPESHSPTSNVQNGEKERDDKNVISTSTISTLTTPIVPLSKANSSRRKHTPKKVVPSLPLAQSDSDSDENSLSLNTVVKVEAADKNEDELYGENQSNIDEFKNDYFDTYKTEEKNEYFDTFKTDDMDTFKSGNLSDDSSNGAYSSFLSMYEYHHSSGTGKNLVPHDGQKARQSMNKDCDNFRNGSLGGFTNMESDSELSGMEGLSGDTASLPDLDGLCYPVVPSSPVVPNLYVDPQRNMKMPFQSLDMSKKGSSRASNSFKSNSNEDPMEAALLDQSRRGVRKYQCPYCDLMVRDRHDLKRHLRTHTKEKPYSCELCNKKFSRKWDQENHVKKHQDTMVKEAYLAKEAEIHVKHNLESISKLARTVQLQKQGLGKKGFVLKEDEVVYDSGMNFLREKETGNLDSSPVKQENDSTETLT